MIKASLSELRTQRKLLAFLITLYVLTGGYVGFTDHTIEAWRLFCGSLEIIVGIYMVGNVGSAYVNRQPSPPEEEGK